VRCPSDAGPDASVERLLRAAVPFRLVKLGLWRCTFDADGATYPAVFVFNVPEPVMVLVGDDLLPGRDELARRYPNASELHFLGESLLVPVKVTPDEWMGWTQAEKVALIRATLDVPEQAAAARDAHCDARGHATCREVHGARWILLGASRRSWRVGT